MTHEEYDKLPKYQIKKAIIHIKDRPDVPVFYPMILYPKYKTKGMLWWKEYILEAEYGFFTKSRKADSDRILTYRIDAFELNDTSLIPLSYPTLDEANGLIKKYEVQLYVDTIERCKNKDAIKWETGVTIYPVVIKVDSEQI